MEKLKVVSAILALCLSLPALTQADSLSQDATGISPDPQPSLYGMQFAKASQAKHSVSDMTDKTLSLFEDSGMWVQVYTGYDFSFMGDVASGTNDYKKFGDGLGYTTAGGGNNSGILAGFLWGFRLDRSNSLALDLGNIINFGNNWTATKGTDVFTQKLDPYTFSASLDYALDIAKSKNSRTYLTVGAGW